MSNKKSNKSKKNNKKVSSTKKMNENNIQYVREALDDKVEDKIQKNMEDKIIAVEENKENEVRKDKNNKNNKNKVDKKNEKNTNNEDNEENIIIEQEEPDNKEQLVKENFYKNEILDKIKDELKNKKKKNSKSRKRKLIFINFIVGAIVELFILGCLSLVIWVPQDITKIVYIVSLVAGVIAAVTLLELGYIKKKLLYSIYGIENFAVTILDLLIMDKLKNSEITDVYNLFIIISASVAIYYIIRAFVINITYKNVDCAEKK